MQDIVQDSHALLTSWQKFVCTTLEAITDHAIRMDEASYRAFRQGLIEILFVLKNNPSSSSLNASTERAVKRIENYQRDTQQIIDSLMAELRDIINVLMSAAAEEQTESQDAESTFGQFQERIEQTQSVEDLQFAKEDLVEALSNMRERAAKHRQMASELQASLQDRLVVLEQFYSAKSVSFAAAEDLSSGLSVSTGQPGTATVTLETFNGNLFEIGPPTSKEQFDSVTGLPSRDAFAESVLALPTPRTRMYVAVFYFQRLEYINARYGYSVGDEVLMFCAQLLATKILGPTEQLFRWRGPSFCALIERKGTLADVRKDIRSRLGTRVHFMGSDDSVLLNIGVASEVRSAETPNLQELIQELEKFVLLPSTHG